MKFIYLQRFKTFSALSEHGNRCFMNLYSVVFCGHVVFENSSKGVCVSIARMLAINSCDPVHGYSVFDTDGHLLIRYFYNEN